MTEVTSLKHLLRLLWFKSRDEEPNAQAGVASGWGRVMLWYPEYKMRKMAQQSCCVPTEGSCLAPLVVLRKRGSDEGGWGQVRVFFSEQGVLERQRGDS